MAEVQTSIIVSSRIKEMKYIVYNTTGSIIRKVICPSSQCFLQAKDGEFVMEGTANDVTQKIINVGIAGVVVDKTPEEIEADNPTPKEIPFEKQLALITNEQWQDVLNKLTALGKV